MAEVGVHTEPRDEVQAGPKGPIVVDWKKKSERGEGVTPLHCLEDPGRVRLRLGYGPVLCAWVSAVAGQACGRSIEGREPLNGNSGCQCMG